MNRLTEAIKHISALLTKYELRYAIVGGLAVSARSEPRFTRDVDIAVAVPGDKSAEQIILTLRNESYKVLAIVEQEAAARLATVRLASEREGSLGIVVDLLFASSGIEDEIIRAAEHLEIADNLVLPIATTGHLLALKILASDEQDRPQDTMDIKALLSVAKPSEIEFARQAIKLITERGRKRT